MLDDITDKSSSRHRFGLVEAMVVVAVLLFGGFALVTEGRLSMGSLLAGYDETIGR